jgi:hypothetical protein
MLAQLNPILLSVLLFAVYLVGIHLFLRDAARLGLGVFRPYVRLSWPVGVQEDDDARFSWTPSQRAAVADIPEDPRSGVLSCRAPDAVVQPEVEVFASGAIATEPVDHVSVHRALR